MYRSDFDSFVVENLKACGKFYTVVIDHFSTMGVRRKVFLLKCTPPSPFVALLLIELSKSL